MKRKRIGGAFLLIFGLAIFVAAWMLTGKSPQEAARDEIRHEFGSSKPDYRKVDAAFTTLGKEKYAAMADFLNDPSETISLGALTYVETLRDPRAEQVMIGALESSGSGWAIARALGIRKSQKAVGQIVEAIRGSQPGDPLRADAALALGLIGDKRGVPGLTAMLTGPAPALGTWRKASSIRENNARARAIGALYKLDPKNPVFEQSFPQLLAFYEAGFGDMRPVAVAELGSIRRPESEAVLREALTDPEPEVRAAAVRALARQHPADWKETLTPLKNDPAPTVRAAAESALASR